ncbi:hypothetical protein AgCh_006017 [Apium graveolens]
MGQQNTNFNVHEMIVHFQDNTIVGCSRRKRGQLKFACVRHDGIDEHMYGQAIDEKIRELPDCHIVYPGLYFQKSSEFSVGQDVTVPKQISSVKGFSCSFIQSEEHVKES